MGDELTALQEHRAGVFRAAGLKPECRLAHRGGCSGELQADHVLEKQRLKLLWRRAHGRNYHGKKMTAELLALRELTLDELLADWRNGWLLCERHHHLKTGHLIRITYAELPRSLFEFAGDYALEFYVEQDFPRVNGRLPRPQHRLPSADG